MPRVSRALVDEAPAGDEDRLEEVADLAPRRDVGRGQTALEARQDGCFARRVERRELLARLDLGDALEAPEPGREKVDDLIVDHVEFEADELELAHERTATQPAKFRQRQKHSTVPKPAERSSSSFQRAVTGTSTPSRLAAFRSISSRE